MRFFKLVKQLFCKHDNKFSLRVEIVGYGYRQGDRVYHKCRACGFISIEEEGIPV